MTGESRLITGGASGMNRVRCRIRSALRPMVKPMPDVEDGITRAIQVLHKLGRAASAEGAAVAA